MSKRTLNPVKPCISTPELPEAPKIIPPSTILDVCEPTKIKRELTLSLVVYLVKVLKFLWWQQRARLDKDTALCKSKLVSKTLLHPELTYPLFPYIQDL